MLLRMNNIRIHEYMYSIEHMEYILMFFSMTLMFMDFKKD